MKKLNYDNLTEITVKSQAVSGVFGKILAKRIARS